MIRFIDLGNQIYCDADIFPEKPERKSFAFFNTTTDEFINFGGDEYFDSIDEFIEAFQLSKYAFNPLERFTDLIPDKWKER